MKDLFSVECEDCNGYNISPVKCETCWRTQIEKEEDKFLKNANMDEVAEYLISKSKKSKFKFYTLTLELRDKKCKE